MIKKETSKVKKIILVFLILILCIILFFYYHLYHAPVPGSGDSILTEETIERGMMYSY